MTLETKDQLLAGLQSDLSRKTYSFVEYVTHASPYVPESFVPLWKLLLEIRREEKEHARILSRAIVSLGGIPTPMLFDESAADLNYLRIDYLANLLVKDKEKSVAEFETRVAQASGFPEIRLVLLELLEAEKRQLERIRRSLEECRSEHERGQGTTPADADNLQSRGT